MQLHAWEASTIMQHVKYKWKCTSFHLQLWDIISGKILERLPGDPNMISWDSNAKKPKWNSHGHLRQAGLLLEWMNFHSWDGGVLKELIHPQIYPGSCKSQSSNIGSTWIFKKEKILTNLQNWTTLLNADKMVGPIFKPTLTTTTFGALESDL